MRLLFALYAFFAILLAGGSTFAQTQPALTPQKPPQTDVSIATSRDVAPGPKVRVSLNTRNVPVVQIALYKLDTLRWLREREQRNGEYRYGKGRRPEPLSPGKPARTYMVTVGDTRLHSTREQPDVYRSKQFNLPELPPGAYLLEARGGGKSQWTVVHITDLAVVVKRAPRNGLVWVTDHRSGEPVPEARVTLFDRPGEKVVTQGRTNSDGVFSFVAPPGAQQTLIVERTMGRKQPDFAGMPLGNYDPDGRLVSYVQTDRPVYRPGATVQYRAILRSTKGQGYEPIRDTPVTVEVRDSKDNVLQRTQEKTNEIGTVAGAFPIPAQGALGAYSLVLTTPKGPVYETFSVAEYRKPDFKGAATPAKTRYLAGEKGSFLIQADYYFGAPLQKAEVRYTIRRSPNPFYGGLFDEDDSAHWFASGDGNLYPVDTYSASEVVADGTVITDQKGRAEIPFPTRADLLDSSYTLTCTTTDGQRRQVQSGGSVPVFAALLRVGIRTRISSAPLNGIVPVDLRLADIDGKPVAGNVTLITRQSVYDHTAQKNVWNELSRSQVRVSATGKASAKVPAAHDGSVEVMAIVQDRTGRKATAITSIWVMDPDAKLEKEIQEPTVTLRLDRKTYKPGDTVQVYLTTSTPSRPTLLTIEGADIFAWKVVPRGKTNCLWKVPATLAMSPNAYISASQWARPAYLVSGSTLLPVPDLSRQLDITVKADRAAYRPGDRAIYSIEARDRASGKPVPNAEIALAVVDESIFAIRPDASPDPFGHFWGQRENNTQTMVSAPEEVSGGAYQRNSPDGVAPVRQTFLDTAFWNARLRTGPDGKATATVELPGNLTSWRATALGITGSTQAGRNTSNITVSRPVMLRLATPRQFVQGDTLTLIGTVSNRTDQERAFEVALGTEGIILAAGETDKKPLTVPAKSEGKVEWKVMATTIPMPSGLAQLEGTLIVTNRVAGETLADYSDRLRVSVPVRPRGMASRLVAGKALRERETTLTLDLPVDRLEPASTLTVTVKGGATQAAWNEAIAIYAGYAYGAGPVAARLQLAATPGAPPMDPKQITDSLALLSRFQNGQGSWGWWDEGPTDIALTTEALFALAALKENQSILPVTLPYPENLLKRGLIGGKVLYDQTGLWEDRALLAAVLARLDDQHRPLLEEVLARNQGTLSPYSSLLLAEALFRINRKDEARRLMDDVRKIAVVGPESAYIPAGERPGWRASTLQTTAQALETLILLDADVGLQEKIAAYLLNPTDGENRQYATLPDRAAAARALLRYAKARGSTKSAPLAPDSVTLIVNGTAIAWEQRAPGTEGFAPLIARIPQQMLTSGANRVVLQRNSGTGDLFALAEATVYRPQEQETAAGMRVLRRFEVQTSFGTWKEVMPGDSIAPSAPLRVTVVVWPNETADALLVNEPIPSGFEYVDGEQYAYSRDEVRDGAIRHYLRVEGATPVTFRYYLRAESEGTLMALPATGELIRRPEIRGGSNAQNLRVEEAKP